MGDIQAAAPEEALQCNNSVVGGDHDDDDDEVRCMNFNLDFSSLCMGTSTGYKIFDFGEEDKLGELCRNDANDCIIVQRLYSSSLVALVSEDYPRKLSVNHFKKNTHICSYTYVQGIRNVLLNRERLIVQCEDRISIHILKDMELIHTITETPPNPGGLCALANCTTNCYLAYPASTTEGVVQIFDALGLKAVIQVAAHESPLQCMAFSDDGTKLATASVKGTVIRVFSVLGDSAGRKLYELRRGMARSATIHSLTFSGDGHFLLASSNTSTVHVFRLHQDQLHMCSSTIGEDCSAAAAATSSYTSSYTSMALNLVNSAVSASASYLPMGSMMTQDRAFAWANLPTEGKTTKVALTVIRKVPRVVVATTDGVVYMYDFDRVAGGECKLVKQHNLNPRLSGETELTEVVDETEHASEKVYVMQKAVQPPPISDHSLDDETRFPDI